MSVQPLTLGQHTALTHLQNVYPSYSDHNGLISRIIRVMSLLQQQPGSSLHMPVSLTRDRAIFITEREFHVVQKAAGQGAHSTAFFTTAISMDGSKPKNQLIKVARKSFDPEVKNLKFLSSASQTSSKIDHFVGTHPLFKQTAYECALSGYIGVFNASGCDLSHIDYTSAKLGVYFIMPSIFDMVDGIASFHRADVVLRDIKGPNLLCNPWDGPGKVTDFGLVRKLGPEKQKHDTAVTPRYAAPYIWDSILGQKYRFIAQQHHYHYAGGYQGKAADVFAFGRTLQLDVINLALKQYAKKHGISLAPYLERLLVPSALVGDYTDADLLAFEAADPGRVFYVARNREGKDILHFFRTPEEVYQSSLAATERLQGVMERDEIFLLRKIALLAKELQTTSKEELLAFLEVENENEGDALMRAVRNHLQTIQEQHSPATSLSFSENKEEQGHSEGATQLASHSNTRSCSLTPDLLVRQAGSSEESLRKRQKTE